MVLGVAYKADVSDVRESPGLYIIDGLRRKGADVVYNDPHVPVLTLESGEQMESVSLTDALFEDVECTVIVTTHSAYDWDWISKSCNPIVDTRNALEASA